MLYIPSAWEARVREWTARYADVRAVVEALSQESVQRLARREE
jgi:hypothetical protein